MVEFKISLFAQVLDFILRLHFLLHQRRGHQHEASNLDLLRGHHRRERLARGALDAQRQSLARLREV